LINWRAQKDKDDSERTCHWLGFTATLTTLFTGMARSDEGVPSSLQSKLPDLQGVGIDLEKQGTPLGPCFITLE
jgi:hypothetical protein